MLRRRTLAVSLLLSLAACGGGGGGDAADGGPGGGDGGQVDATPAGPDRDGDGVPDDEEIANGTDPDNPDSDGDGLDDGDELSNGSDPNNPDSDGDGVYDGDEIILGTDPTVDDQACADLAAEATLVKRPIDIILVVDSSSSMGGEIDEVQANLNTNLAAILAAEELDYRVILIGDYPTNPQAPPPGASATNKLSMCISTPLGGAACTCTGGASCTGPATPAMTERFKHYDVLVDSRDGLRRIIDDFDATDEQGNPGWGTYLRDDAQKVFLIITDDDANNEPNTFAEFDAAVLALSPEFGTSQQREYVYHAILGMAANSPATSPWLPSAAVQTGQCTPGSDRAGVIHQEIAIGTGGLRFPLCNNDNFDVIFQRIADDVVEGSMLGCSFTPTPNDPETALDFDKLVVYFTPGGDPVPMKLQQVADEAACVDGAFYEADGTITLCPSTCETVQADASGELEVHVACNGPIIG